MNIPNVWEVKKLGDLIINFYQGINTSADKLEYKKNGTPIIQSKNITSGYLDLLDVKFIDNNKFIYYKSKYNPKKNDLLFSNIGTIGKSIIVEYDIEFVIAWNLFLIRLNHEIVNVQFLKKYFDFLNNKKFFETILSGGTVKFINKEKMGKIEIPLPPLEEQKKIASILERADNLRKKRKEANKLFDELLQSVFLEIFGDPFKNINNFKKIKLVEVLDFLTSGSRGWAQYYSKNGQIFIRIQNVKNGFLDLSEIQYINPPNNKEAERTKVKENDLLISITADLGRTAVVDKKTADFGAYINQHLALVRTSTDINSVFLSFLLESNYGKNQFNSLNQEGVKAGLNFDSIRNLNILLPPIELQNQFVQIVEKIEALKEKAKKSEQEIEDLFNSLMQNAFNGQLDLSNYEVIEKELVSV